MEDPAHSEVVLRSLRSLGVQLSLDDFGTGYSSRSYLKLFPFHKVKIDQSFVRGLMTDPQDAVIARVVISTAHGPGLRVIAEGVETEAQAEFMRANMCDEIQGYFFSRPVPGEELEALIASGRRVPANLTRGVLEYAPGGGWTTTHGCFPASSKCRSTLSKRPDAAAAATRNPCQPN